MKKYFLGIAALTLAIGFSAFTVTDDIVVYEFNGDEQVEAEVETRAEWGLIGLNAHLCTEIDEEACRIGIKKTYIDTYFGGTAPLTLAEFDGEDDADDAPELTIDAEEGEEPDYFIVELATFPSDIQPHGNEEVVIE